MRFLTYESPQGGERVGLLSGDEILGFPEGRTMIDVLDAGDLHEQGERVAAAPAERVPYEDTALRAPLQPRSIRDCTGFLQHLRTLSDATGMPVDLRYEQVPQFYFSNSAAVIGPYDEVPMAPDTVQFDFELEIAAVIGKPGANIALADAERHIAGYTLFCDWSARDLQLNEMPLRLGPAKGKDTANTLGPVIVTPDELEPFRAAKAFDLAMSGCVNGEQLTTGNWSTIDWGFPDMVTYAARGTRLRPGDVIGSGTVPSGCLFEHSVTTPESFAGWLEPGDVVTLAVEHLGEIRHRVIEGMQAHRLSTGH